MCCMRRKTLCNSIRTLGTAARFVTDAFKENGLHGLLLKSKLKHDQSEEAKDKDTGVEELLFIYSST